MANPLMHKIKSGIQSTTKLAFFLGCFAILLYANTFKNGYVLDDFSSIVKNSIVTKGVSAIPEIFHTPYLRGFLNNPNDLYRPLSLAMFAIEYQLFDGSPVAGHVINVLLFAFCVMLLFAFLDSLFEQKRTLVAFIAAFIFAAHPVHTEVVANIKSRDELLCFFFAFLSLHLFLKFSRTGKWTGVIGGAFCFFVSLLSKETSITFLVVIPAVFFLFVDRHHPRSWLITASAFIAAIIFLVIRISVLKAYNAWHPFQVSFLENSLAAAPSVSARIATAIFTLGYYLKLLFVPYPLSCDYSYNTIPVTNFSDSIVLLSGAVYLLLAMVCIYRLIKHKKDPLAFAIAFFLLTMSLFSNLFFLLGATMAERFLFFPSVGFCICAALLIEKFAGNIPESGAQIFKRKQLLVLIPLLLMYSVLTFCRNEDWFDALTLYRTDSKKERNNSRLFYYLGTELIYRWDPHDADTAANNKLLEEGIENLKKSIAVNPYFNAVYTEIGITYFNVKAYDSAEQYFTKAIALNTRDTFSINKLAGVYFKKADYARSIEFCKKAISIDSGYSRGYRNIGICYLKIGKYDSSIAPLKQAMRLDDNSSPTFGYLAIAYNHLQIADSTKKYDSIAKSYNPGFILQ